MSKREEFRTFISTLKSASPTITNDQRKSILRLAVQEHGLTVNEATDIFNASGILIGETVDSLEILGLSIAEIQKYSSPETASHVEAAHKKLYNASLKAGGRPRSDGRTEQQWRTLLNQARDTLTDPRKRQDYLKNLQTKDTQVNTVSEISNLENMALIPAGDFVMGSSDDEAFIDEHPIHNVFLDEFYIDQYPVTNAQYKTFVDANPQWGKLDINKKYHDVDYLKHWRWNNFPKGEADYPAVNVSWYAAMAYAQWKGKRLPTEAEWEKAARGGLNGNKYPWGNSVDPTQANYDWNIGDTTPIGKYPANSYKLYDMCGNVWEWCLDEYDADFYRNSPSRNPISGTNTVDSLMNHFIDIESNRVLRGGSWRIPASLVRIAKRNAESPSFSLNVIGFRCVYQVSPTYMSSTPPSEI